MKNWLLFFMIIINRVVENTELGNDNYDAENFKTSFIFKSLYKSFKKKIHPLHLSKTN